MASRVPPSKNPIPADRQPLPPTADLEVPEDYRETFQGRSAPTKYADPCKAASKASYDCLERAHYNRNECMDYFKAYRECKKRWLDQMKADKAAAMNG